MLKKDMVLMYSLSEQASCDLDSILDYSMDNFGVEVMLGYHHSLERCFTLLAEHPDLGTAAEHVRDDYFCFYHRSHAVFYTLIDNDILIVRVLHKSMDVPRHF